MKEAKSRKKIDIFSEAIPGKKESYDEYFVCSYGPSK
jgi:hypothetical protein